MATIPPERAADAAQAGSSRKSRVKDYRALTANASDPAGIAEKARQALAKLQEGK